MTDVSLDLVWKDNMIFQSDLDGHKIIIDVDEESGGNDLGPRPKKFLLLSLLGCTSIDMISLMKKMRVDFKSYKVTINTKTTEEHPKVYDNFVVIFKIEADEKDRHFIEKAMNLSKDKYCGVYAMLSKVGDIEYKLELI